MRLWKPPERRPRDCVVLSTSASSLKCRNWPRSPPSCRATDYTPLLLSAQRSDVGTIPMGEERPGAGLLRSGISGMYEPVNRLMPMLRALLVAVVSVEPCAHSHDRVIASFTNFGFPNKLKTAGTALSEYGFPHRLGSQSAITKTESPPSGRIAFAKCGSRNRTAQVP